MNIDPRAFLSEAIGAYQQGNLALTDALCEILLRMGHRDPAALLLLGLVGVSVKEYKRAAELLREAQQRSPGDPEIRAVAEAAKRGLREQAMVRPDGRKRYLVIKAWGYGFCSDLDHVLGGLLLAEMTGRTPIVHWGAGSLFRDDPDEEGWRRFFEPVSKATPADVEGKGLSYVPPKWNDGNLRAADVNKLDGEMSRVGAVLLLNRREEVAVSDMHVSIAGLQAWIRPGTPYAGKTLGELYRAIIRKFVRVRPEISQRVDAFAAEHFNAPTMIGVHVRGGDKPVEDVELLERNKETPGKVEALMAKHPEAKVFLLTDDSKVRTEYVQRFGGGIVTTDCLRTSTAHGLHYLEQESKARLGVEVLVDMYLAARCDYFLGVGTSNVSAMIEHLKDWVPGAIELRPTSIHYHLNPFLYRTSLPPEQEAAFLASVEAQKRREAQGGA